MSRAKASVSGPHDEAQPGGREGGREGGRDGDVGGEGGREGGKEGGREGGDVRTALELVCLLFALGLEGFQTTTVEASAVGGETVVLQGHLGEGGREGD